MYTFIIHVNTFQTFTNCTILLQNKYVENNMQQNSCGFAYEKKQNSNKTAWKSSSNKSCNISIFQMLVCVRKAMNYITVYKRILEFQVCITI